MDIPSHDGEYIFKIAGDRLKKKKHVVFYHRPAGNPRRKDVGLQSRLSQAVWVGGG